MNLAFMAMEPPRSVPTLKWARKWSGLPIPNLMAPHSDSDAGDAMTLVSEKVPCIRSYVVFS
jgi:hypothetical protein